jgi:hypothetical protein
MGCCSLGFLPNSATITHSRPDTSTPPPVFVYANRVRLTLTYNPNRNPGSEPVQTFRLDSHHEHRRPHQFNPHPFYLHNTNQKQVD